MPWLSRIDLAQPWWTDYRAALEKLRGTQFPDCKQLNSLLPAQLASTGDQAIRFVPSTQLGDGAYEYRIYTTGQVSTRPNSWHDLFNALVWTRLPLLKSAMNALHFSALSEQTDGQRGPLRDALTLFDECGVCIISANPEVLNAVAAHDWPRAFQEAGSSWGQDTQVVVSGHAILEKYLKPYKSMTAKVMLVQADAIHLQLPRRDLLDLLDKQLASRLLAGKLLLTPSSLGPLPLAGIPGWWPCGEQDDLFYADQQVFRPPGAGLMPAPVIRLT